MKRPSRPYLLLLPLLAVLLFGNCARNAYRLLGPGTTPAQVAHLQRLNNNATVEYQAAVARPAGWPGPTPQQVLDSADAARHRLLTPEQYQRQKHQILPLRYPLHPPRRYR